jgi:outer membrane protein insertion porin family
MSNSPGVRAVALLLAGTMLAGVPAAALAQATGSQAPAPQGSTAAPARAEQLPAPNPAPERAVDPAAARTIRSLRVEGSQRIEPETVLSYTRLRVGTPYTAETLDQALKDLQASDLFADFSISGVETGDIVLRIRENPIINRVIFEGNKALKQDKIDKEVKLRPRQIFTRSAVRADVARIVELYRRQGRFAAAIEPKMVSLDQNRVDVVFEINEGPKSKVRQINIIGNEVFDDDKLRGEMATKQARWFRFFSSGTSYDQDRLNYDQQKLRQFYLTEGYADFRVISAVAELTPDKRDFIITYVVEEGKRYKFGDITVDSEIRDFDNKALAANLPVKKGEWYNAKQVEDSVEQLNQTAGLFGYAFTDVNPEFIPDREALTMSMNFNIAQAQRTYVERIDISGNTQTQDKVIRREIRLAEGDAFNSFQVKRSQDRINSLGFFQDKFEIKQNPGSAPDRIVLDANVEERSTGELQLSAGYSSLERLILQANITQRNFRGKGQELRAGVNYSTFSRSVELGFTEPYLFDRNIAVGVDLFRRDFNNFNFTQNGNRNTTFQQVSTGFQVRTGLALTEYWSLSGRYGLSYDQVSLDESQFFTNGVCDPFRAGRFLCDQIGNRYTSSVGFSIINDSLNSRLRPTAGSRFTFGADFAGLGGDVRYARTRADFAKFWGIGGGFIASVLAEGGWIRSFEDSRGPGIDKIRIVDRFFLGEPQFRGFQIRGVGPRVLRIPYITGPNGQQILETNRDNFIGDDALGGRAYYLGRLELEIPLGSGARELGLRPSIYVQAGSLFGVTRPLPTAVFPVVNGVVQPLITPVTDEQGRQIYVVPTSTDSSGNFLFPNAGQATLCPIGFGADPASCTGTSTNTAATNAVAPFAEQFLGNNAKPRLSVGFGVNWNSPFGPLRIDVARALLTQPGDDPKLVQFNVGTQF